MQHPEKVNDRQRGGGHIKEKMKESASPPRTMKRDETIKMLTDKRGYLAKLLKDLKQ